ncbi:MAG TPA: NAD(P)-dependent oxidoreductase [Longimicrobiales bacterium]|nr:NAD(P)-dependent oxidoreductase [Longimicrobiales bacterium]
MTGPGSCSELPRKAEAGAAASALAGRRILVTGASGFLGSHLCGRLVESGGEVYAVSRRERSGSTDSLRWCRAGLEEIDAVRRLLREVRPDLIYHFAGHVSAAPASTAVLPTFYSLLASTVNLLAAAIEIGCIRFVLPGSMTEPEPGRTDEAPSSPYVAAKWAATAYGRMFHALYGTPVVIVRPAITFGPGQPEEKLIPYVIRSLSSGTPPRLTAGRLGADWTYIDDMSDALLMAGYAEGLEGQTIDLGTGTLVSVRQIVTQLVELIDPTVEPDFGAVPDRPGERVRAADVRIAREKMGWRATTPLHDGLRRTVEWYMALEPRP